jgi:hypothetical protein
MFLVDTGSSVNIFNHDEMAPGIKLEVPRMTVSTLGGKRVNVRGMARNVNISKEVPPLGKLIL